MNGGIIHRPANLEQVGKSKTEVHGGGMNLKPGVSTISNPRLIDNGWLNTFKVIKYLKREVFSDLFEIKMSQPSSIAGEIRVLRKIRKVMFRES